MLQTGVPGKRVAAYLLVLACCATGGSLLASEHDEFIPTQTPFYLGTGEGMPISQLMAFQPSAGIPTTEYMGKDAREMLDTLSDFLTNMDKVLPQWGVDKTLHFSTYAVGAYPVLRVALDDIEKFNASLEALEDKYDLQSIALQRDGFNVRYYDSGSLPEPGENESKDNATESDSSSAGSNNDGLKPGLLIATSDEDLIVSVVSDAANTALVDKVLGATKPKNSIAASGKLKQLRKQWGYANHYAAFIDFDVITDDLTNAESQSMLDIQALMKDEAGQLAVLEMMRSEPCRSEIKSISKNWPMLVMGAREFELDDGQLSYSSHGAAVIGHQELRDTLQLMRGVLPESQSPEQPLLSIGLGVSVDRLTQIIGQMTTIVSSMSYECPLMAQLNEISKTDLSAASMGVVMFGGLARGVEGVSMNIFDLDIDTSGSSEPIKGIDTALTVTAADPQLLVQTLQMMPQLGMLAELPLDGTEISLNSMLPVPMPPGVEFKAAIKEKNVVIFSGDRASDFINRLGSKNEPGFFHSMLDTRKIIDKITSVMEMFGQEPEELESMMQYLESYPKGTINYNLDFTENGIELSAIAVVAVPE